MCVNSDVTLPGVPAPRRLRQIHEITLIGFEADVGPEQQQAVMEALGVHLCRCEGMVSREFLRAGDGRWVEHVVWAGRADLEASTWLEDDPVVAELFSCFDAGTVSYGRCELYAPDAPRGTGVPVAG